MAPKGRGHTREAGHGAHRLDARHRQALPSIIAGDFNATPDAASIRYLTGLQSLVGRSVHYHDTWSVVGKGPGHTWTIDNPNGKSEIDKIVRQSDVHRRVDHVFVGSWDAHPDAYCRVRAASRLGGTYRLKASLRKHGSEMRS
jgi:endonuclease/exonuclease/phosphatase family metal-dependent hydrolase